jgi:hypothetical protein
MPMTGEEITFPGHLPKAIMILVAINAGKEMIQTGEPKRIPRRRDPIVFKYEIRNERQSVMYGVRCLMYDVRRKDI